MGLRLRTLALALVAGFVLPACVVFTIGGEDETPTPTPTREAGPSPTRSLDGGSSGVTGSGRVKVEERAVSGFDRLRVNGAAELFIEQTGEESLTIEAEDNLLPLLASEVEDGRLTLGVRPGSGISATRPIIFRLKVKSLREVEASGAGSIHASQFDVPELRVDTSGSVASVFAGTAAVQELTISGSGRFDGRDLEGERASVDASGTGEVIVNVSRSLEAEASGTASVRYLGAPEVTRRVSGLGAVEPVQ